MKSIILLSLLTTTNLFAETYICTTEPEEVPSDVFIIEYNGERQTSISYQRFPFYGAEVMPFTRAIEGCAPAQYANITGNQLYVECDGDGDAGFLMVTMNGDNGIGTIDFPEGNIGYEEDTVLKISCTRQ